jgi:RNA polymerase sigma factor (sigma-70 family)
MAGMRNIGRRQRSEASPDDEEIARRQRLVADNLGLAGHLAKRYLGHGLSFDELVSAGFAGLCEAARAWDESRGVKFTSYAGWWIRREILDDLWYRRVVRMPKCRPYGEAGAEWDREKARETCHVGAMGAFAAVADRPPSPHSDTRMESVREAVRALPSRHREIVEGRAEGRTLADIGLEYGICRQRVQQIHDEACRMLRRRLVAAET